MAADPKSVVRRLYEEVWNKRRLETVKEVIASSHALNDPHMTGSATGPEAYKRVFTQYIAAFPDLRFEILDMICEKDKVVVAWTISGTHKREYRGIAPTNKKVSFDGVTINHVANGKIIDSFLSLDYYGLLQQLGAAHALEPSKRAAAR